MIHFISANFSNAVAGTNDAERDQFAREGIQTEDIPNFGESIEQLRPANANNIGSVFKCCKD